MNEQVYVSRFGMQMDRRTWGNFRWDFISAMIFSFFNVMFNQFYIPIAIRHGASNVEVGLLVAAPAIGLLFSPIWAGMIDGRNAKSLVVLPNLVGRLLVIVVAWLPHPWLFVAIALVFNMLMGIQSPAYATLMTQIYPAELRGRIMGNVRVVMGIVMIPIAYFVGSWMDKGGFAIPMALSCLLGAASSLSFSKVRPLDLAAASVARPRLRLADHWTLVKDNPALLLFLAATTASGFGNLLANPIYQIIQVQKLGLTNGQIGLSRVAYYVCLIIAYWVMGWVIDRFSPRHAMYFGIGTCCFIPLLYSIFGNYPAVLVGCGLQGISDATWDIGCLAYVFRLAPGREAVVFGLHLMLFGIRGTIGPLLSTGLAQSVPSWLILDAASSLAWIGLVVLFLSRRFSESANRVASSSGFSA